MLGRLKQLYLLLTVFFKVFFENVNAENSPSSPSCGFIRVEFQLVTFAARLAKRDIRLEKLAYQYKRCRLFFGVEYCTAFQAALYIETHSMMHQSEFHAASVALSH